MRSSIVLIFLFVSLAWGGTISWKHSPSPSPSVIPSHSPSQQPPHEPISNVFSSFVPLLRQGSVFNVSVSVPVVERTDTSAPFPAMIAAEDFRMPLALQTCHSLVVDIVLFRQLGRVGNYRVPSNTTFWLFSETQTSGPFNRSRALAERVFAEPSEGQYDPPGATGGATTDHGNGYYFHVERLRFVLGNLTLRANTTYWLAALVSIDRAYNVSDFSQNTVRWPVSEVAVAQQQPRSYRVVDWHHNTFRDVPTLANWTDASVAESTILPSITSLSVHASHTRQLALDLYATECNNVTRLPVSLELLAALPLRDASQVQTPSREVVAVTTPSPAPSPPPLPTPIWASPSPALSPTSVVSSPPPLPTPIWPSPSSPAPHADPPSPDPVVPSPSPSHVTIHDNVSSSAQAPLANNSRVPIDPQTWIYVGVAALILLVLLVVVLIVALRQYRGKRSYTSLSHGEYIKETQDPPSHEDEDDEDGPTGAPLKRFTDTPSSILADDGDDDDAAHIRLDDEPGLARTRGEAELKQSILLMREVPLDGNS